MRMATRCASITCSHQPPSVWKVEESLIVDPRDHEPDLIEVSRQHDLRSLGITDAAGDERSKAVLGDLYRTPIDLRTTSRTGPLYPEGPCASQSSWIRVKVSSIADCLLVPVTRGQSPLRTATFSSPSQRSSDRAASGSETPRGVLRADISPAPALKTGHWPGSRDRASTTLCHCASSRTRTKSAGGRRCSTSTSSTTSLPPPPRLRIPPCARRSRGAFHWQRSPQTASGAWGRRQPRFRPYRPSDAGETHPVTAPCGDAPDRLHDRGDLDRLSARQPRVAHPLAAAPVCQLTDTARGDGRTRSSRAISRSRRRRSATGHSGRSATRGGAPPRSPKRSSRVGTRPLPEAHSLIDGSEQARPGRRRARRAAGLHERLEHPPVDLRRGGLAKSMISRNGPPPQGRTISSAVASPSPFTASRPKRIAPSSTEKPTNTARYRAPAPPSRADARPRGTRRPCCCCRRQNSAEPPNRPSGWCALR